MNYLPSTLRNVAMASRTVFDLAIDELDYWRSKKEFLAAGALFQKLPWWAIYPDGLGAYELRAATMSEADLFRIDLVQKTAQERGLEVTEELIRILSACERPADQASIQLVSLAIDELKDPVRAFELGSYWNTSPYFVCWDTKENIGKIYSSGSTLGSPIVSNEKLAALYLEASK